MPRMLPASSRTSSIDLASLTPPPLPRPPAWICAFTTQTPSSSASAALTASSTEKAGMPRGVGMPKRRKISLPWYSWIFTKRSQTFPSAHSAIPLRIIATDGIGRRLERVTAVELEGFVSARLDLTAQTGEHLDRSSGRVRQQFGEVAAAAHATHRVVERLAKAMQQTRASKLRVCGFDPVARFVRHAVGADLDRLNDVVTAHGHAHPHVMYGRAGRSQAREQRVVVILDVGQVAFEIEQPVVAPEAFVRHPARVQAGTGRGRGKRHGVRALGDEQAADS